MTKPELYPTIIFRVPRFPFNEPIEYNWDELKECIKVSSPEFYNIIAEMSYEELLSANFKIQLTVRKYYNRAAFRSTPYGLFSAIGVTSTKWNKGEVTLAAHHTVHSFADWRDKPVMPSTVKELIATGSSFFTNTTFYRIGKEIRYIQKSGSHHQIAAVDYDEAILSILEVCSTPKTFTQIKEQLAADKAVLEEYLQDLMDVQLLFTSLHPNIIGKDYFSRIGHSQEDQDKKYIITERRAIAGNLDQKMFKHLPELVLQMQKILEVTEGDNLKEFKERFVQKFDQAEIPLMIAIDPEAGVGYGGLETHLDGSNVTDLLENINKQTGLSSSDKLRKKLYQAIYKSGLNAQVIDLNDLIDFDEEGHQIPNSLYALCTLVDEHIYIDALGGSSATALSGRFALAIPEIHDYCKEIAAVEETSNPDVLLFDIGYTKEDGVDNINRRPATYGLQLNILNFDTSESPLCVNDILISVHRGEVILRSLSLDKRLVPRFASAYNYKRADLPLFRLLMDIQSQGLQPNLTLRPSVLIPGLPYYPRIQFRNIIVAPAAWLLDRSLLKDIVSWEQKSSILSEHLRLKLPCTHVRMGLGDQTLLLDINNKNDLAMILSFWEHDDQVYVEEAYLPHSPVFTNINGQQFLPQVVVTLTHTKKVWDGLKFPSKQSPTLAKKNWIGPGREWLYFEIYGNPFCLDDLLLRRIKPFLQAQKQLILSWFFIRYNENGDHIRLRLKLKNTDQGYSIIGGLTELLKEDIDIGTVADIKLCTYKKEVHRYSAIMMELVEAHFHQDSRFVFSMLGAMLPDFAKYRLCIDILDQVYESKVLEGNEFESILSMIADSLKAEYHLDKEGLKRINKMFKEFEKQKMPAIAKGALKLFHNLKHSMIRVLEQSPEPFRPKLFADLMHMHINRLFVTNQRLHELVIYDFYNGIRKRKKYSPKQFANAV